MSRLLPLRIPHAWSRTVIALAIVAVPITITAAPALAGPTVPVQVSRGVPVTPGGPVVTAPSTTVPSADPIWWRHGGWGQRGWNRWGNQGWNGWGNQGWNGWGNQGWNGWGNQGWNGFGGGWGMGSGSAG